VSKLAAAASKVSQAGAGKRFTSYLEILKEPTTILMCSSLMCSSTTGEYTAIEIKPNETMDSFIGKINQNKELGITAIYDEQTGAVAFQTRNTGESADIAFEKDADTAAFVKEVFTGPDGWEKVIQGQNAEFSINGLSTRRENNSFTIAGLAIDLKAVTSGPVQLEVAQDTDAIFNSIKGMVDKYNELIDEIQSKINEPFYRDYPPLTEAQKKDMDEKEVELWEEKAKSGLLRSDRILTDLAYNMRRALGSIVGDLEGINSLHQIGISTGSWFENGKLHINESKLRDAIENKPDEVLALFTQNSEDDSKLGIARKLNKALEAGLDRLAKTAGKTTTLYDTSTLSEKIRRYEDQISAMEERLIRIENRYWAQFTAMERALSEMYAQSDWLYQQMMMMGG
jgi:flagellar hook-associated protein 2